MFIEARPEHFPMRRIVRYGLLFLLLLALVVSILFALFASNTKPAPWFSAVASGNAYDSLAQAASEMNGKPSDQNGGATNFVQANSRMFERVESALKLPFEIPLRMYSISNSPLRDLSAFKTLAHALRLKGMDAAQRGMNADAATNYINIIRLGQHVEHGPLIALLVGIAIEKMGLDALEQLAVKLTPEQRKNLAGQIESLDKQRLPFPEIITREYYFARQVTGNPIKLLIARFMSRAAIAKAEKKQERLSSDFHRAAKSNLPPKSEI
jgi:hypothetical protein